MEETINVHHPSGSLGHLYPLTNECSDHYPQLPESFFLAALKESSAGFIYERPKNYSKKKKQMRKEKHKDLSPTPTFHMSFMSAYDYLNAACVCISL